ncbi:MAG: chorismate-binding protein, partial [Planctomycetota bacterium]
ARLDVTLDLLTDPAADTRLHPRASIDTATPPPTLPTSTMGDGGYPAAVERIKEYIAAGDAFQVVPSQRFELRTAVDPFDVYRALRVVNPSPYLFYLQVEGAMLVGSSPEILCRVDELPPSGDGQVKRELISRPLAGTRRRGRDGEEDAALEADLRADPKDRSEHVMLVDLHRNDVGRVAEPGTIELTEVMTVERYSHVMHLSSEVRGTLRADADCWDALRVCLPVGTVSGAPKVRAMQIIDEFEPTRRGPYGGAVGYADLRGRMDTAIALRTMVVTPAQDGAERPWVVHLQAGGGIVYDSDPQAEHQETLNKAAALAKAVDLAEAAFAADRA